MMFPSAVQGHMPYVDKYKQEQIKKALQKNRHRHHSGPEKFSNDPHKVSKHRNTASMPILWQSVYAGKRPRFISMPTLDDERRRHLESPKSSKNGLLNSLKSLFKSKKDSTVTSTNSKSRSPKSGVIVQGDVGKLYTQVPCKKPAEGEITPGGRSPKRQRMRTVSNISAVMETIEEINELEALISTDNLSDDGSSDFSEGCSIASAPELSRTNLFYSGCADSHDSSHHSSAEILCSA